MRAERALIYGKSSLDSGDTLVILHPQDYKPLDPTGFGLNKELRVHSKRLISTGSQKFEKIFSPEVQRAAREFHYPDGLPKGIDFILDLRLVAPMNLEDAEFSEDVSEQLKSELTCSKGIRSWFSSQGRCGTPQSLVGGQDAIPASNPDRPGTATASSFRAAAGMVALSTKYPEMYESHVNDNVITFHADMLQALKISAQHGQPLPQNFDARDQIGGMFDQNVEDVLEYCPVRYRIGIEHLLQIIEGREPTWLDSAQKVWTLYVVAKYFECTPYVVSSSNFNPRRVPENKC